MRRMNWFGRQRSFDYAPWQTAFSRDALRRAWTAVRANQGTAGPDGETVAQFERQLEARLHELGEELKAERYRPHKVTQLLVPKPSGSWRPLTLWAVRDRIVQRAVYNYLEPVFEPHFLPCSFGFRPGLSTQDAAQAIQQARIQGAEWVLDADIKDCFGTMDSQILLAQLKQWRVPGPIRNLIRYWLEAKVWNAWAGGSRQAGTSQGGVISPLLCNVYLHPFDLALQKRFCRLVRYADDFVILGRNEHQVRKASRAASAALKELALEIHPQKSRVTSFSSGFQFVGWFFVRDEMYRLQ